MRRIRLWLFLVLPAALAGLLAPAAAPAATDYFLKIDGIEGESTDSKHKGEIDVLSYSWGVSAGASPAGKPGSAGAAGRPAFSDFSFMKRVDRASPELMLRAATGDTADTARLSAVRAGERTVEYLTFCLRDVRVTSVQQSASTGDDRPTESLSVSYGAIVQTYREQRPDGSAGPSFSAGWDLVKALQTGDPNSC